MDDKQDNDDLPPLTEAGKKVFDIYKENKGLLTERKFTGDGTWTAEELIYAVVTARTDNVALSKAAASFGCREDRPDTLWEYDRTDSFDLVSEFKDLPEIVVREAGQDLPPLAKEDEVEYDRLVDQILSQCDFSNGHSVVYNEWGKQIRTKEDINDAIETSEDSTWIVVGISLKPTAAGEGYDEYIGATATIFCPNCGDKAAECVNIRYAEGLADHYGIWICGNCGEQSEGPTPDEAISRDQFNFD